MQSAIKPSWFFPLGALLAAVAIAAATSACGGDDGEAGDGTASTNAETPASSQYSGVVVSSDVVVGPNRFAVGIIDETQGRPALGLSTHLRFFKVTGQNEGQLRSEADAEFVGFDTSYVEQETGETVTTGETGVYVVQATFDEMGAWGVEITAENGDIGPFTLAFEVLERGVSLTVGDPAPRSRQTIASGVADQKEIDTMVPLDPFHDVTIADAISAGKPVVVLFGTPGFCETQTCAPVMDTVMLPLYEEYGDGARFIHVEPYFVPELRSAKGNCAVPAFNVNLARAAIPEGPGPCPQLSEEQLAAAGESWNLTTEPILFVIDGQGNIAAKLEGIVGPQELEAVLQSLVPA